MIVDGNPVDLEYEPMMAGRLWVALAYSPENAAARAVYARLGFVETGEKDGDEVIAQLDLGPSD